MLKAIVIGIDAYPNIPAGGAVNKDIPGAVAGALRFFDWLRAFGAAREHENAPENEWLRAEDVALHLSPSSAHPHARSADAKAIKDSFDELRKSAGKLRRVFVYFNGHGFSATTSFNGSTTDYIACGDFSTPKDMTQALRIDRIKEYVGFMGPCEQYFFFDCCRNVVAGHLEGGFIYNEAPDPTQSKSKQMLLYSARPGEAVDAGSPFGAALLGALSGKGTAKAWRKGQLLVDFGSVCEYIRATLDEAGAALPEQEGNVFGYLYRIRDIPKYECAIEVGGDLVEAMLEVVATKHGDETVGPASLDGGRGKLSLAPDYWSIAVRDRAGRYAIAPAEHDVELFDPAQIAFSATPSARRPLAFESIVNPWGGDDHQEVELAHPPNTSLEVLDSSGKVLETSGLGSTTLSARLKWGRYVVQLRQADRVIHAETIVVARGGPSDFPIRPATLDGPLRSALIGFTGGGYFMPSERLGPIWDGRLSLWLASVVCKAASGRPHGPLQPFPAPKPSRTHGALYLGFTGRRPTELRCSTIHGTYSVSLVQPAAIPDLWLGTLPAPEGPAIVGWQTADGERSIATCFLRCRVTTVVVCDAALEPRTAQQFFVIPESIANAVPPDELPPNGTVDATRSLVNAQEAFASEEALGRHPGFVEPLFEMLAAYEALRNADPGEARPHVETLLARFPALPDSALLAQIVGLPSSAARGVQGVPLMAEGVARLRGGGAKLPQPWEGLVRDASFGTSWTSWNKLVF
ncbi:MAG: hypothetical protein HOW73_19380 [Polyangiaceae bacterium]|nr:hypothetical protein [Polyangiaceae bacterium]